MTSNMRDLFRTLRALGAVITITAKGHARVARNGKVAFICGLHGSSNTDRRHFENTRHTLVRTGVATKEELQWHK